MPDPFRHYEGAPVIDLPADPPRPRIAALDVLLGGWGQRTEADGITFLSELLFYSASISASKRVPSTGSRYALRVNPSSGNLHPTELHFSARGLRNVDDGLYHYRPSSHMMEQRATGSFELGATGLVFVLTSIAWREAWKYRDRAYRYCLHDMGHAWQSLELAARALGCRTAARGRFDDDGVSASIGLPEDEYPLLILELDYGEAAARSRVNWHDGVPNRLSREVRHHPMIDGMHARTKIIAQGRVTPVHEGRGGGVKLPAPAASRRPFSEVVRSRRSALDFAGGEMPLPQLSAILVASTQPLAADFADSPYVQLYLYIHGVTGLAPGVYRHWAEAGELELVMAGDQRVAAAGLSLGQNLAGNACVAFSMIGDLERAIDAHGDRGYRYVHFEAGAIGQRMYLAAEAFGLRATGIGAFYDDHVHRYLGIDTARRQVVYHFAIGHAVADPRLEG